MEKKTKYINVFGAPGTGKSTFASYIFSQFKIRGMDCEFVTEFAKDMVWQGNPTIFKNPLNQFYIGANQLFRMLTLDGKVDYIITDSPILLSSIYNRSDILGSRYNDIILELQYKFDSGLNYLMVRTMEYVQNGRNESKEEAENIHKKIKNMLTYNGFLYKQINGHNDFDNALNDLLKKLKEN